MLTAVGPRGLPVPDFAFRPGSVESWPSPPRFSIGPTQSLNPGPFSGSNIENGLNIKHTATRNICVMDGRDGRMELVRFRKVYGDRPWVLFGKPPTGGPGQPR